HAAPARFNRVVYGDSFVLLGQDVASSTAAGLTFTPLVHFTTGQRLGGLTYGKNTYMAVGTGVFTSENGKDWLSGQSESGLEMSKIAVSDGSSGMAQFVAGGQGKLLATWNGVDWENVAPAGLGGRWCLAVAQGKTSGGSPEFIAACDEVLYRSAL